MDTILVVIISFGLIFVVGSSLGNGFSITVDSVRAPLKTHRQLNIMLVLGCFFIIPALIIGLMAIIPFSSQVKMAFCVLALSAGAPFIPWITSLAKGNIAYAVSAVFILTLITFIILPLALPAALNALGTDADLSIWHVAWPLILFMLVPLIAGMIVRARYPQLAQLAGQYLGPISLVALLVHVTLYLAAFWDDFISLGGTGAVAFAFAFPIIGLLIGYLLSPPYALSPVHPSNTHRGGKIVSAAAGAQRNTGASICTLIFALGAYPVAGVTLLLCSLITLVMLIILMAEVGKRFAKKQGAEPNPGKTGTA